MSVSPVTQIYGTITYLNYIGNAFSAQVLLPLSLVLFKGHLCRKNFSAYKIFGGIWENNRTLIPVKFKVSEILYV